MIPVNVISRLLEPESPSMNYRTMKELLDKLHDEIQEPKSLIANADSAETLCKRMHPDGYWLQNARAPYRD